MDSEILFYNLKTKYYENKQKENELCELSKRREWNTKSTFFENVEKLQENKNTKGQHFPLLDETFYNFLIENMKIIESISEEIQNCYEEYPMSYFGLQTLKNKYLLKTHDGHHESIDDLWLRVALFIHWNDWTNVKKTYLNLRQGNYIHATPTLFNAGLKHHQMASCFVRGTKVLTKRGYVSIEKVEIGDFVWTHQYRWKKVTQKHTNALNERDLYIVKFKNSPKTIRVTGDHKFYTIEDKKIEWKAIEECNPKTTNFVLSENYLPYKNEYYQTKCYWEGVQYYVERENSNTIEIKFRHKFAFELLCQKLNITIVKCIFVCNHWKYIISINEDYDFLSKRPTLSSYINAVEPQGFYYFILGMLMVYQSKDGLRIRSKDAEEFVNLCSIYQYPIKNQHCDIFESRFSVSFPTFRNKSDDGITQIKSIRQIKNHSEKNVYTLGVEDDHSYVVGNVFAKNCFLLGNEDSIKGIFESIGDCAQISKFAGGIGLHTHTIRSDGSYIYGTNGISNGIVPMLKVYNDTARYVDQGGGKRNGSIAVYLEPWHSDILQFLFMKRNIGAEETKARDLFYGLWIPDYFMECVQQDKDWYLFDPSEAPQLNMKYGKDFNKLYLQYVDEKRYAKCMKAREIWKEICRMQIETGTPYILYKDQCNKMSNQKNIGTIQSSNLCCEIIQYSDHKEYAVCNLASISLPNCCVTNPKAIMLRHQKVEIITKDKCVFCDLAQYYLSKEQIEFKKKIGTDSEKTIKDKTFPQIFINDEYIGGFQELWNQYLCPIFSFQLLGELVEGIVENLNQVIDRNKYPLDKCEISNKKHRPMGIGVQGLADVFMKMLEPYDSVKSRKLNEQIFETMYYHAMKKSIELARKHGSYSTFEGSPLSKGILHFDMNKKRGYEYMYDWNKIRNDVKEHGIRNSLLIALMPTASTSQILGNTESFEPLTSNFYTRRVLTGEYYVMNRILQDILYGIHLWDDDMHERLLFDKGSVQKNDRIPKFLKNIFRTVWEIPQKHCIEMASDRQRFVDQSQSMNIYLTNPSIDLLTKIHFYGWKKGLKTGSYYIRSRSISNSQNFCIDAQKEKEYQECENCSA